jgi:hypothetical protein
MALLRWPGGRLLGHHFIVSRDPTTKTGLEYVESVVAKSFLERLIMLVAAVRACWLNHFLMRPDVVALALQRLLAKVGVM